MSEKELVDKFKRLATRSIRLGAAGKVNEVVRMLDILI